MHIPGLKVGWMTWTPGSLYWRVKWSHSQTKLSGCDPDITCFLENSVGV